MAKFVCCFRPAEEKKEKKVDKELLRPIEFNKGHKTMKIRLEHPVKPFESDELITTSFNVTVDSVPFGIQKESPNVKVKSLQNSLRDEEPEIAYEGEDEHEEIASMKRDLSDVDLQANTSNSAEEFALRSPNFRCSSSFDIKVNERCPNKVEKDSEKGNDEIQTGHVSDPGIGKAELWGSPKLKRSCSNLETSKMQKRTAAKLTRSRSASSRESEELYGKLRDPGSPASMTSHCSADRVMLKKHSSSQVLPSRSRKLWWKLFLWSHRNLHRSWTVKPKRQTVTGLNQHCGYYSDTVEPNGAIVLSNMQSPGSFTGESQNKGQNNNEDEKQNWDGFHGGISGLWPQKQWVAFSVEASPFARVDEWVKELATQEQPPHVYSDDADNSGKGIVFPPSPEIGRSPARILNNFTRRPDINLSEEVLHANCLIQSLNSSSTVAHISGIGLKAIPTISCFTSLRSVNLSNNFIVYISPGSLPKGLHTLNLSRNKINAIEGLRELTRLRVLDLSYNRISRIGQGLSNCTIIKELYLAGNKISDVEGLHRLLKLTVLDLSFNKITTTKALGQLVANYNSLQALNLLGNPIQNNISEDQLRKAVCSLLPKLVYLNKQSIKPQRAREVLTDTVAKAALGTSTGWSSRRRVTKRSSSSGLASSSVHRSNVAAKQKTRSRSKSRTHHQKTVPSMRSSSLH
ncbi:hypothetical protein JCGZ_15798 [Jatropha curcas]|uniref:Uncharacterized protein n=1 Tax=Jatropha curcas TaxID=180498 RepID=A0A067KYW2_JATCU|nr:uncharacterized protein LOC105630622 [Jatropha curcas]XP_012067885.1 uncharacterized protein LOC105630622 [Jatropha curcas]XP_037494969.1 uncharacterized protein LOC105630622 [Jatropha curcas]KDP41391.1 hypothetical protein JCGZ_15798 [Jatropha curcas]